MLHKTLEEQITIILNQSDLSLDGKEELRKELTSHFHEQVHQLGLQGYSEAHAVAFVLKQFGSPELIGRELFYVHKNIYFHNLFTFIHVTPQFMKKNLKKIFSIVLLLVALWANDSFFNHAGIYKMLGDCIEDMSGFQGQGKISPDKFAFDSERGVFDQIFSESQEQSSRDYLIFGMSSGSCAGSEFSPAQYIENIDIDADGSLTQEEVYVAKSVGQVNIYLDTLHANLYPSLLALLILGDAIVLYLILGAWTCKKAEK